MVKTRQQQTLTLREIGDRRIIQRTGQRTAVRLEGSVAGTAPARIETRLLVAESGEPAGDWQVLSRLTLTQDHWSGTMQVPAGGFFRLEVRGLTRSGKEMSRIDGRDAWGVGDIFAVVGSSTPERWFLTGAGCPADPRFSIYKDGWRSGEGTGIAAASFANRYIAASGAPVGLMNYGVSGTLLRQWVEPGNGFYKAFRRAFGRVRPIAGVILHLGGNDARSGSVESQATHESRLRKLIAQIRRDTGQADLPIFVMGSQRAPGNPAASGEQWTWVRAAELSVAEDPSVHFAVVNADLGIASDSVHLDARSMRISAERVADTASRALGFSRKAVVAGPVPMDASPDPKNCAIFVRFDLRGAKRLAGRRSDKNITGFRVSSDGFRTLVPIVAAEIVSVDTVRLKVESMPPDVTVDYLTGANPDVSNCLYGQSGAASSL